MRLLTLGLLCACTETIVYPPGPVWPDDHQYPPIGNGKILITNNGDDTVTWIDIDTLEPVLTEPVGRIPAEREGPHHGAAEPDGSAYFVGISNFVPNGGGGPHGSHGIGTVAGYLLKYDTATHELAAAVQVDRNPGDVRITPDGRYVLQSHFDLVLISEVVAAGGTVDEMRASLAIIDPTAMRRGDDGAGLVAMVTACIAPHGIRPSADSTRAYLACWGSDEIAVVGLDDPYPVERFPIGDGTVTPTSPRYAPYALTVSPVDGSIWVSNQGPTGANEGDVRVFDPASRTFRSTVIQTGGVPFFGDFTTDGRLLMPNQNSNTLTLIEGEAVAATLPLDRDVCDRPHAVLVLPGDDKAVLVCEGDHVLPGTVVVVTLDPLAVAKHFAAGVYPDDAILLK